MMGRGSSVVFGKVAVSSETESIERLTAQLEYILKNLGYPSDSVRGAGLSGDEPAEFDEELEKMKRSVEQEEDVVFAPEDDARSLSAAAGVSDLDVDVPRDELIDELVTTKKVRPWARKKV